MRFVAAFVVALALPLSFAGAAEATRPIVGYSYTDLCKNIPGKQPVYMTIGSGPYRVVKPGVCRRR